MLKLIVKQMNREDLQKRLDLLTAERSRLVAQYEQIAASINAMNGGIAEAQYWLSQCPISLDELKTAIKADSIELLSEG